MKHAIWGALAALALATPAQGEHLYPRNECGSLEGADAFQMKLVTAVANRDEAMLRELVDPQVQLDFGGGSGWEEMRGRLNDEYYKLWDELDRVTRLGCARLDDNELALPWLWGQDLGFDDPFSTVVAIGSDVPLLAEPRAGAKQIRLLNWEAVTLMPEWNYEAQFAPVRTKQGEEGFVEFAHLRSQVDYRLIASRNDDGVWRIIYFIAGD
jgi:hypothetical protein